MTKAVLALIVLAQLTGCSTSLPTPDMRRSFARLASGNPAVLQILSISYSANQTNVFRCVHSLGLTTWTVSSNACPLRVDLVFIGPESSNCVIEFQPELGYPRVIVSNAWNEGQGWCEVSPVILLTGQPQTFATGAISNQSSFYRARLK